MSTIIRWVLNWVLNNAAVSIYTSPIPVGQQILGGGFNIPQVTDVYLILTVLINHKPVWTGYFQAV